MKQDLSCIGLPFLTSAIKWIFGMQNSDGGWGAFDLNNDRLFLNNIPFSDMDSLCDPSTADVTGRILELLDWSSSTPNMPTMTRPF